MADFYDTGLGPGWWIVMMLGMVVFWSGIVVVVVWAVRGGLASRGEPVPSRGETPQEILQRRLAEGTISVEEYEQRRASLTSPMPGGDDPHDPDTAGGQPSGPA